MVVGDIATGADLVVIGAGPGGYTAAIRAAQRGLDVIVVEKEDIGGTCLNRGCIPAKSLIHAAKFHKELGNWQDIGIKTNEDIEYGSIQEWKKETVNKLNSGVKQILEHHGVNIVKGTARFTDSGTLRVEEEHDAENIEFENAIIATGSRPIEIPGLEFENERIISSRELLQFEEEPDELIIVGGGYIGLEAATKLSTFGTDIQIVEAEDRILPGFDSNMVKELQSSNETYTKVQNETLAKKVEERNGKAVLKADHKGDKIELEGDYVLVAAGRTTKPVLENLGLENTSVELNEQGFIEVDKQMRTSDENIYAVGDVVGQPMLAHKAYREGRVAAEVVAGEPSAFDNQYIPKVMYTDPEVAIVGMTPEEASEEYDDIKTGRFPFTASGRAMTVNDTNGFIRVVASSENKLLGVQIIGSRASEMIAEATLALEMQAYLDDITNTIHAHPTFAEGLQEACEDAMNESIHTA